MKWDCRDFESKTDNDESDGECLYPTEIAFNCKLTTDFAEQGAAGDAVQQAHAVQHDGRGEHAE